MTAANLGPALAAFQRLLVATIPPFDRYMRGDSIAMTPLQVRGIEHFSRIGCANCHLGPICSDYKLHVSASPTTRGCRHRTPASRVDTSSDAFSSQSRIHPPYMHSGIIPTLDDVIEFYDDVNGGRRRRAGRTRNPQVARADLDPLLHRLNVDGGRLI